VVATALPTARARTSEGHPGRKAGPQSHGSRAASETARLSTRRLPATS